MRVRGLKPSLSDIWAGAVNVAPRAGAWIETGVILLTAALLEWSSHPVRVRGLKLQQEILKVLQEVVAPRAGAWIETFSFRCMFSSSTVAPRAGAWIETEFRHPRIFRGRRRTPCGCVD